MSKEDVQKALKHADNARLDAQRRSVTCSLIDLPRHLNWRVAYYFEGFDLNKDQKKAIARFGELTIDQFFALQFSMVQVIVRGMDICDAYKALAEVRSTSSRINHFKVFWHLYCYCGA